MQMTKIYKKSIVVVAIVILATIVIRLMPEYTTKIRIINKSEEVISSGEVSLCDNKIEFQTLAKNDEIERTLEVKGDCHFDVKAIFASGKRLTGSMGYVTSGVSFDDEIWIFNDRIELGRHRTK
jgi:hypothetical protein